MAGQPVFWIEASLAGDRRFEEWCRSVAVMRGMPWSRQAGAAAAAMRKKGFRVLVSDDGPPGMPEDADSQVLDPSARDGGRAPSPGLGRLRGLGRFLAGAGPGSSAAAAVMGCAAGAIWLVTSASMSQPRHGKGAKGGQYANKKPAARVKTHDPTLTFASKDVYNGIEHYGVERSAGRLHGDELGVRPAEPGPAAAAKITPQSLAEAVYRTRREGGFTVSPVDLDPDNDTAMPTSGVSVAFDTTHMPWKDAEHGQALTGDGQPNPDFLEALQLWIRDWEPVLKTGDVWVGGWYDDETGELEINLTFVFRPEYRDEAIRFGGRQDQKAVYDLVVRP